VSAAETAAVGFVGLGAIGSQLARGLLEAGVRLVVYDRRPEAVTPLLREGAVGAESVAEIARGAEAVMVSLPTPEVVREVLAGEGGLLEGGAMRTFVDLSTTGPRTARELSTLLAKREIAYVDAPVSGGVIGAEARRLAVFVGAEEGAFERVRTLLEAFSETIVHVGPRPGQGQLAKLLNNLLSATAMAITSEAMAVGVRSGLEPDALLQAFNAGSGRNSATASKFPGQVVNRRFESGFRLRLMLKDVRLALEEARAQGVPMPVGGAVEQLWTLAGASAEEDSDHTEVVRLYEEWAGVEVEAKPVR
jgi:3-hydroxyisobutyrate dehydrogenase-like beta-hydroxyacid dehydrogenase